eukprot:m.89242 g.89242  ORF g.89242 m.89242 type:complete len:300 (+) comp13649_c1_seq2:49-948(+)
MCVYVHLSLLFTTAHLAGRGHGQDIDLTCNHFRSTHTVACHHDNLDASGPDFLDGARHGLARRVHHADQPEKTQPRRGIVVQLHAVLFIHGRWELGLVELAPCKTQHALTLTAEALCLSGHCGTEVLVNRVHATLHHVVRAALNHNLGGTFHCHNPAGERLPLAARGRQRPLARQAVREEGFATKGKEGAEGFVPHRVHLIVRGKDAEGKLGGVGEGYLKHNAIVVADRVYACVAVDKVEQCNIGLVTHNASIVAVETRLPAAHTLGEGGPPLPASRAGGWVALGLSITTRGGGKDDFH